MPTESDPHRRIESPEPMHPVTRECDPDGRVLMVPESAVEREADPNRMLARRSPVGRSRTSLVSRDYQPRTGGPELVASWPLGAPPSQTELGAKPWEVSETEFVTLQHTLLTLPYATPIGSSPLYLNFCGRAFTDEETTLTLRLSTDHLEVSGSPYETEISVSEPVGEYLLSPMIEVAPDTGEYDHRRDIVAGYDLEAKVSEGIGYVDQGSAVQLWSE